MKNKHNNITNLNNSVNEASSSLTDLVDQIKQFNHKLQLNQQILDSRLMGGQIIRSRDFFPKSHSTSLLLSRKLNDD